MLMLFLSFVYPFPGKGGEPLWDWQIYLQNICIDFGETENPLLKT